MCAKLAHPSSNLAAFALARFSPSRWLSGAAHDRRPWRVRKTCPTSTPEKPRARAVAHAETPAKLISASELQAWFDAEARGEETAPFSVLDVRGRVVKQGARDATGFQAVDYVCDDAAFFAGHIPSARFVDWRTTDLIDHEALSDGFAQCGVDADAHVVVYDWGDMLYAARVWFALVALGCRSVHLLNGGWAAWDALDGAVSIDTVCPLTTYSEFESPFASGERPPASVGLAEMRAVARRDDVTVLDARARRLFDGSERRSRRGGHVTGAMNVPFRALLAENRADGLLPDAELRRVIEEEHGVKIREDAAYVSYCNGGVASSLLLFCLVRCGVPLQNARNYCGSMNEWGNLDDTPLE